MLSISIENCQRSNLKDSEVQSNFLDSENLQNRKKIKELESLIQLNEANNKKLSKQLQKEKVNNEKFKNQLIEFKHTNSLIKMETDILGGRLNILAHSIQTLGTAKEAEEKSRLFVQKFREEIEEFKIQRDKFEVRISELIKEKEQLYIYLKDTETARMRALDEKDRFLKMSKEKMNFMENEMKELRTANIGFKEQNTDLKKSLKLSTEEREILREKITQMKLKRNMRVTGNICRICNKDYNEKENFKWS